MIFRKLNNFIFIGSCDRFPVGTEDVIKTSFQNAGKLKMKFHGIKILDDVFVRNLNKRYPVNSEEKRRNIVEQHMLITPEIVTEDMLIKQISETKKDTLYVISSYDETNTVSSLAEWFRINGVIYKINAGSGEVRKEYEHLKKLNEIERNNSWRARHKIN